MDTLKIAIAGIGTVGSGLLDIIIENKSFIEKKINKKLLITAVASRKKIKIKKKLSKSTIIFKDARKFLEFDNYDVLVELIGGEDGVSLDIISNAIKKKKNVVTANKALIAKHGTELLKQCEKVKCKIGFEAAVAGGIPIIKIIKEFLISNKIKKVFGILNGTSNFILSKMQETNKDFSSILKQAQNLGFAESDPKFDINGMDTAHKTSILSMVSFGNIMDLESIFVEGIEGIKIDDIKFADTLGYRIKLLGITQIKSSQVSQFVYPCLINKLSTISNVSYENNGVVVESDFSESLFFQGQGAGSYPTATSVLSDIIDISKENCLFNLKVSNLKKFKIFNINDRVGSYYLRLTTFDKPGVISGISNVFKKFNISMKSMLQQDSSSKEKHQATIVLTTHDCLEKDMQNAIKKINALNFVVKKTVLFRIEKI